ncbi:MAG: PEGA domain-containing protein [Polyangiaceae bacterium]
MSEDKGSDLDVFEGLAKKDSAPASVAVPPPPGTLRGGLAPPSGPAPLPPPSAAPASAVVDGAAVVDGDEVDDIDEGRNTPVVPAPTASNPTSDGGSSSSGPGAAEGTTGDSDAPDMKVDSTEFMNVDDVATDDGHDEGSVLPGEVGTELDWDDEEEQTQVFAAAAAGGLFGELAGKRYVAEDPDETAKRDVAKVAALLASSGGSAAPVGAHSAPPPAVVPNVPEIKIPAPAPLPAEVRGVGVGGPASQVPSWTPSMMPPQQGRSNTFLAVAALCAVVAGLYFYSNKSSDGSLEIRVTHLGSPVSEAQIYVDGQRKCEFSPCKLDKVSPGTKSVRVKFGLFAGVQDIEVKSGEAAKLTITVGGAKAAATTATSPSTAEPVAQDKATLKLGTKLKGIKVSINGDSKGALPLQIKDLAPGKVKLKFDGGEDYEPLEKEVELAAGETLSLDDVQLKLLRAEVTFVLKSPGAVVKLVRSDGTSTVLNFASGKITKKLEVDKKWSVAATLKDHLPSKKKIDLGDEPEVEVTVKLERDRSAGKFESRTEVAKKPPKKPEPKDAGGYGTINANSIPPSRVIIDGRPRGSTPVTGVRVTAGSHSVVFIHKKYGRKARRLTVAAGQTKTAVVRFKKPKK